VTGHNIQALDEKIGHVANFIIRRNTRQNPSAASTKPNSISMTAGKVIELMNRQSNSTEAGKTTEE